MPGCVLRVDGAEFDPDAFLSASGLVADAIYRRGDQRSVRAVHTTSGFTALVCDEDENGFAGQVRSAIEYLRTNNAALSHLRSCPGVAAVLDFGCDFPTQEVAGRFYQLPLTLLAECTALGIEIELSVYMTQ
ncbi:Uncharacterized protein OS=Nonlabens marinus S1-08 GN=NMS_1780 PE=4 SV=1 [Gemmata massiliana]|uniref:DUF4279 domain-containing protein n=1 Tax=Gemmata massiliana TaxID=1210884 RepID=A0A6P2D6A7_9BACT|nr:hypothetical protein [Gemmata massiliana]VTR96533.1 Uncharacterized protein OS=Nonlabens marinus S1-08 GN=NMS_1780 PE=4 SV=1 [Gemmata massiliana]